MIYDTLFGIDAQSEAAAADGRQVGRVGRQDDLHASSCATASNGTTARRSPPRDCVASIQRWAARDGGGQHMMLRVADIVGQGRQDLRDRAEGALRPGARRARQDQRRRSASSCARRKPRPTRTQQIDEYVGSGPFTLQPGRDEPGSAVVYDRNPNYVPRSEPPSGISGGKVVKVDRVIYENIARRADRDRSAAGRRDRLLRDAADRPAAAARGRSEHQARGAERARQCRLAARSTTCTRPSTT